MASPLPGASDPQTLDPGADVRILRLIQKGLTAGVLEDGVLTVSERGTGQGSVISPLLASVTLHYVIDLFRRAMA